MRKIYPKERNAYIQAVTIECCQLFSVAYSRELFRDTKLMLKDVSVLNFDNVKDAFYQVWQFSIS